MIVLKKATLVRSARWQNQQSDRTGNNSLAFVYEEQGTILVIRQDNMKKRSTNSNNASSADDSDAKDGNSVTMSTKDINLCLKRAKVGKERIAEIKARRRTLSANKHSKNSTPTTERQNPFGTRWRILKF